MAKKGRQQAEKQAKMHQTAQAKKLDRAAKKEFHKNESRKRGRQSQQEDLLFDRQLQEIGLRVIESQADGNCMFRSIADQIEGSQHSHRHFRQGIMNFINEHREDFEPFMEDDEKFDAYLSRMCKDGEWGGHQELYAASRLFNASFVIHQFNASMFHIQCDAPNARTYHLSYHGEMHYNSIRNINDDVIPGIPPQPINIQLFQPDPNIQGSSSLTGSTDSISTAEHLVSISLPHISLDHIRATLQDVDGNPEHAIELLVSGYVPPDTTPATTTVSPDSIVSDPMIQESNSNQEKEISSSSSKTFSKNKNKLSIAEKKKLQKASEEPLSTSKVMRGELCPCGSNKK
mmetsp:Transcript_23689/g.30839  ORF Transcript_23689/g.30839 Transcript_23689/m.30839 type:complete len:345 (-) Transcript_23689:642-1676(-)